MKLVAAWFVILAAAAITLPARAQPRGERVLGAGWKFDKADVPAAIAPAFDDSSWQSITLPHTWNAVDGARGGPYYRGPAWYRRHFRVDRSLGAKRLYLRFGAASLAAWVYVNGHPVGSHAGGFGAFCFDVTSAVRPGDNVLSVRVDNAYNPDISPLSGDFTVYGGLYREVSLLALNSISISPLDDASPGVYIDSTQTGAEASVRIRALVRNATAHTAAVHAVIVVWDARGRRVGGAEVAGSAAATATTELTGHIAVKSPNLWDGVNSPYLYRVTVNLFAGRRLVDRVSQRFGIRTFRVDPERGLLLNGKPYDMHGVNVHQGRPSCGWAATAQMQQQDYDMVRELGCTGVRMPHYQHADHEYTLCDERGLVVWAELALVNHVTDSAAFRANINQQLRELIHQNYNHPSILFWSMYNEPSIDRARGDGEWQVVRDLVALAHRLDPTRLTTGAVSMNARPWLDWCMDVTAFNRYWGWYDGEPSLWQTRLPALRHEAAGKTFGISEYGAGASVHQHELNPKHPKVSGKWHPEEWQSLVHEQTWPVLRDTPWLWCKLVWVMFDFASSGRNEGDHAGINDKGLVTGDRKVRKDAFYYYKAQWTKKPFVYITDRRFNPHPAGLQPLKVYSNCDTVELFLNGVSLGARTGVNHVFVWPEVNLPTGTVRLRASARSNAGRAADDVKWTAVVPG